MSEQTWTTESVGALIDAGVLRVSDGYRAKNSELGESGLPFARAADVRDGFHLDGADILVPDSVARAGDKVSCAGDVVFTSKGTVGRFAFVGADDPQFVYSPQLCFWRVLKRDQVDPRFLYFWMSGDECLHQFRALKGQTDMADYISLRDQRHITLRVPPLDDQRKIGRLLGTIEAKATNARVVAERATALLWLIFEHEVVRSDDEAEGGSLASIARYVNGKNFTNDATGTGRPVLRIKELNSGLGPSTVYNDLEAPADHVAQHFDLLFAWSGTLGVHRWDGPDGIVNQHIFKVIPKDDLPTWLIEGWLRHHLARFEAIARDKATTMGHIKRGDLDVADVRVPRPERLVELDGVLGPLDALRAQKRLEATRLRATMAALLPGLVSGRTSISPDYAGVVVADARVPSDVIAV